MRYIYSYTFIIFFVMGCASHPSPQLRPISYGEYREVDFSALPSWKEESFDLALEVYLKTCQRSASMEIYKASCLKAKDTPRNDNEAAKVFFETNFTPFASSAENSLATGYYEPYLDGSSEKTKEFAYPVYGVPKDLIRIQHQQTQEAVQKPLLRGRMVDGHIQPYFTRAQIASDALGPQRPICYVNDAIALFFLQVQGSGCIRFQDGSILYLGYGDTNGHPYVSIGKEMIKQGLIEEENISLKSIVSYFNEHPRERDRILGLNPSYIFFEPQKHSASGAFGVILQEERSVAVDRDYIPLGMPLFISTIDPQSTEKYDRLVFAHDTGSAIKGESRIDIFFGSGKEAGNRAGKMKEKVNIWMLVPNDYLSKQEVK